MRPSLAAKLVLSATVPACGVMLMGDPDIGAGLNAGQLPGRRPEFVPRSPQFSFPFGGGLGGRGGDELGDAEQLPGHRPHFIPRNPKFSFPFGGGRDPGGDPAPPVPAYPAYPAYPAPPQGGHRAPPFPPDTYTEHILKHYLKKDCSFAYRSTPLWFDTSKYFLAGYFPHLRDKYGDMDLGATYYRDFHCVNGMIRSSDREWPDDSSPSVKDEFWIAQRWRKLFLEGECIATDWGGLQLDHPLPKKIAEKMAQHLSTCVNANESLTSWYKDRDCTSHVANTYRAQTSHTKKSNCIDTVDVNGDRYGVSFDCVNHALQETHYGDYAACDPRSLTRTERVYTHQYWKRFMTGECVKFDFQYTAQLSRQFLTEEAVARVDESECGQPMAEIQMFTRPGCHIQDRIVVSDLVSKTNGCIHMTSMQSRRSMRYVERRDTGYGGTGSWAYDLYAYQTGDCSTFPYWSVHLTVEAFKDFQREKCIAAVEAFTLVPVYFALALINGNPFYDYPVELTTSTTTTTSRTSTTITVTTGTTATATSVTDTSVTDTSVTTTSVTTITTTTTVTTLTFTTASTVTTTVTVTATTRTWIGPTDTTTTTATTETITTATSTTSTSSTSTSSCSDIPDCLQPRQMAGLMARLWRRYITELPPGGKPPKCVVVPGCVSFPIPPKTPKKGKMPEPPCIPIPDCILAPGVLLHNFSAPVTAVAPRPADLWRPPTPPPRRLPHE